MRLHTLSVYAVGPFADRQEIDFDRLSAGGLFLFEGPTGVGKSTILDALTFALYGGLASASSDPARIRSDFVAEDVRPEVRLEFSVHGRRYRITRSPSFERPRRRGTGNGMTREQASVHLQAYDAGTWTSLSHSKAEVGTMVGDLLGLSQEQFRKVVLLPQGEFAAFLGAEEKDRAAILTSLFGTELFAKVTEELRGRATRARAEVRDADVKLEGGCAAAWEAAGEVRTAVGAATAVEVSELSSCKGAIAEAARHAAALASQAEAISQQASAQRQATAALLEAVRRHRGLVEELAIIESGRREQEARVERAALARRSVGVRPVLDQLDDKSTEAERATAVLRALGMDDAESLAGRGHDVLAAQADEALRALDRLQPVAEVEASLAAGEAELEALATQAGQAAAALVSTEESLAALPEAARAATSAADEAAAKAARVEALRLRLESVESSLTQLVNVRGLEAALTSENEAVRAASREYEDLDVTVRMLESRRLEDLSGLLAVRLVSGDPCMVCGSREHPQPADARETRDLAAELRIASAERDEARIVLDGARGAQLTVQAELAAARSGLGTTEEPSLTDERERLAADLSTATAAAVALAGLRAAVSELTARTASLADERTRLTGASAALDVQVKALRADLSDKRESVKAARGEFGSVAEHLTHLGRAAESARARASAVVELGRVLGDVADLAGRAERESVRAGFADAVAARGAVLSESDLAELEAAIAAWQVQFERLDAQLRDPALSAVAALDEESAERDDLAAADALEQARQDAQQAQGAAAKADQRVARFADRLADVLARQAERDTLAASAEQVIALDEYARGQAGSPRMPLVTYVLRYWFEQVVDAANLRLAAMSSGKYQLQRTDIGARRDSKVGLGLAVLDRHTGKERSPGSLSGGETFYASLSLALGLADVVVAQTGGADLDTLFIDEGFGTLDGDTLELVMAVIDELRGNGRVVGIVSHVPDLKERIPERLSVRRVSPHGPSKVTVLA